AQWGKPLLAADELADDMQLELPAERSLGHCSAPQRGPAPFPAHLSLGQGHARLLLVCLSLGVHHTPKASKAGWQDSDAELHCGDGSHMERDRLLSPFQRATRSPLRA